MEILFRFHGIVYDAVEFLFELYRKYIKYIYFLSILMILYKNLKWEENNPYESEIIESSLVLHGDVWQIIII